MVEAAARLGPSRPSLSTIVAGTPGTRRVGDTLAAPALVREEVQGEVMAPRMLGKLDLMIRQRKVSLFLFRNCGTWGSCRTLLMPLLILAWTYP